MVIETSWCVGWYKLNAFVYSTGLLTNNRRGNGFIIFPSIVFRIFGWVKYRLRFGIVKTEIKFPFVSALTFRYLCWYEDRLRFGIVKSETRFPFVSALTLYYLCLCQYR